MGHTHDIPSHSNPTANMQGDPFRALHQLNMMALGYANFKKFILSTQVSWKRSNDMTCMWA